MQNPNKLVQAREFLAQQLTRLPDMGLRLIPIRLQFVAKEQQPFEEQISTPQDPVAPPLR
jgi:hypothetical protein